MIKYSFVRYSSRFSPHSAAGARGRSLPRTPRCLPPLSPPPAARNSGTGVHRDGAEIDGGGEFRVHLKMVDDLRQHLEFGRRAAPHLGHGGTVFSSATGACVTLGHSGFAPSSKQYRTTCVGSPSTQPQMKLRQLHLVLILHALQLAKFPLGDVRTLPAKLLGHRVLVRRREFPFPLDPAPSSEPRRPRRRRPTSLRLHRELKLREHLRSTHDAPHVRGSVRPPVLPDVVGSLLFVRESCSGPPGSAGSSG